MIFNSLDTQHTPLFVDQKKHANPHHIKGLLLVVFGQQLARCLKHLLNSSASYGFSYAMLSHNGHSPQIVPKHMAKV